MSQQLAFKKAEVVLEKPQTLKSILEEKMLEQNLDLSLLDTIKNHLIYSVDNVMVRSLDTVINVGQKVRLIPAVKAG